MTAADPRAALAVEIAVNGLRRSWETAWRIAVRATPARRLGLVLGGLLGDALALERHLEQPAERLEQPLEVDRGPGRARGVTYSQPRPAPARSGTTASPSRGSGTGARADPDTRRGRQPPQRLLEVAAGEDRRGGRGEQRRLALPPQCELRPAPGLGGPLTTERRQAAAPPPR